MKTELEMKPLNLSCLSCGASLIHGVTSVSNEFIPEFNDEQAAVPPLRFAVIVEEQSWQPIGHYIFNFDDLAHLPLDENRIGYGCCGYSDCNGPNLFCFCGEAIGFKYSECYTPRMAILKPEKITLTDLKGCHLIKQTKFKN